MFFFFHFQLTGETLAEDDPDRTALWQLIDHLYTLLDPSIDAPLRALPFLRFMPGKYGRVFRETIKARDRVARRYFDTQKVNRISVLSMKLNGAFLLNDRYVQFKS